jgi:hypothetical protein
MGSTNSLSNRQEVTEAMPHLESALAAFGSSLANAGVALPDGPITINLPQSKADGGPVRTGLRLGVYQRRKPVRVVLLLGLHGRRDRHRHSPSMRDIDSGAELR